jgi:hypothetical protein
MARDVSRDDYVSGVGGQDTNGMQVTRLFARGWPLHYSNGVCISYSPGMQHEQEGGLMIVPPSHFVSWCTDQALSSPSCIALRDGLIGQGLDDLGVRGQCFLRLHIVQTPFWGLPSLPSIGYWGLVSRGKAARDVKLTAHLQLVPRLSKRGYMPPLPHTSFWHSAWLVKHRDNFPF